MIRLLCMLLFCAHAPLWALDVYNTNSVFYTPDGQGYVESVLLIPGNQLRPVGEDGQYAPTAEISLRFTINGEQAKLVNYLLDGAITNDSLRHGTLIDLKRTGLGPGNYELEVLVRDFNNKGNQIYFTTEVKVELPPTTPRLSNIALIDQILPAKEAQAQDPLYKNGQILVPYPINFYPQEQSTLTFYCETYATDSMQDDAYLLTYKLVKSKQENVVIQSGAKKFETSRIQPFMASIDIAQLASGNYELIVDIRNKKNHVIARRTAFIQRSNISLQQDLETQIDINAQTFASKYTDLRQIHAFVQSLFPIASQRERLSIKGFEQSDSLNHLQRWFAIFWMRRDAIQPEQAWENYRQQLKYADYHYRSSIEQGYETDRGRVYLIYGKPNNIVKRTENDSYPYEVWHYYSLPDGQSDIQFVFYNRSGIPGQMVQLHSNARQESSNANWRNMIYVNGGSGSDELDNALQGF